MKNIIISALFVIALCLLAVDAEGSWLIDAERYHVSAHGQNSCQDCHADIADKPLHPDPAKVSKRLREYYRLEQCTSCHEDILEDLDDGTHGGEKIAGEEEFKFCIGCHDPHYQLPYSDEAAKLDLSEPVEKKCSICHEFEKELPEYTEEDQTCMECHVSLNQTGAHAVHSFGNCVGCHMPRIAKSAESGDIRSHVFATLLPKDTLENPDIPNSCQTCHKHKDEDLKELQERYDELSRRVPKGEKVATADVAG